MKTLTIKPGSILLWKDCSKIKRWLNKLFCVHIPYNKFYFVRTAMYLCVPITKGTVFNCIDLIVLEPKVDYTKEESSLLKSLALFNANTSFDSLLILTNTIRSNTIKIPSKIDELLSNKNYKVVYDFSKKN